MIKIVQLYNSILNKYFKIKKSVFNIICFTGFSRKICKDTTSKKISL